MRRSGRSALMPLMVCLTGCLSGSMAFAQARVDRTLSMQPAATPSPSISDLPAAPAAVTPAYRPPAPVNRSRASGAYTADAMGATILAKNADYETTFRINAPVPAGSTISKVTWRYGLSGKPAGFEAVLCWSNQQRCWNVTNEASGSTQAFNGNDAAQPFTLHYRVKGSGPLGPPAQGEMNQIIVTYDLP